MEIIKPMITILLILQVQISYTDKTNHFTEAFRNWIHAIDEPNLKIAWTSTSCKVRDKTRWRNPTSWEWIEELIRYSQFTKIRAKYRVETTTSWKLTKKKE